MKNIRLNNLVFMAPIKDCNYVLLFLLNVVSSIVYYNTAVESTSLFCCFGMVAISASVAFVENAFLMLCKGWLRTLFFMLICVVHNILIGVDYYCKFAFGKIISESISVH